ncbi:MAG: N-acetylmuramoyl-L-alanine amidase [Candidatus Aceula meridiana]|nr:N-acetylmuramoyl-L-alanine amidase [Candidatus Aceula meridiana]
MSNYFRYCLTFSLAIFLLTIGGCASAPKGGPGVPQKDLVLKDLCVRYGISCVLDSVSQVITLKRKGVKAKAILASDVVVVDSKKVRLSKAVWMSRGTVYVPDDFKRKVVQPMFAKTSPFVQKFRKVMLDAGHGGKDPGGIGNLGTREKEIVLDIAQRIQESLKRKGIDAVLTRNSDQFLELGDRTALAQKKGVDLFVSIHANIDTSHSARGIEIYHLRPLDTKSWAETYAPKNYQVLFKNFKMKQGDETLEKILTDMMYSHKQQVSYQLSRYLADKISKKVGTIDRGAKTAGFYVLKNTLVPAVLIEVGFLSHPKEEKSLCCQEYRQKLADSIAESLIDYAAYY